MSWIGAGSPVTMRVLVAGRDPGDIPTVVGQEEEVAGETPALPVAAGRRKMQAGRLRSRWGGTPQDVDYGLRTRHDACAPSVERMS